MLEAPAASSAADDQDAAGNRNGENQDGLPELWNLDASHRTDSGNPVTDWKRVGDTARQISTSDRSGDTGDTTFGRVVIWVSPQNPISPQRRKFGVQHQVQALRKTRVILSGKAWEWWWWETDPATNKKKRRTRYGGLRRTLPEERQNIYERNRAIYWKRKINAAARREADELARGA